MGVCMKCGLSAHLLTDMEVDRVLESMYSAVAAEEGNGSGYWLQACKISVKRIF